ncbi:SusD-like starch-binding protein associating with outer membrane [Neolewinella xylanilytica]|uniref:SusD-like starch-binding protein associating with outer membrane n=1 Tax=Neolewinella xylanilytica TaxID=1514080 RepID=A0A2S6I8E4_9BACT|nr:SusD/RagB family nutrient-binding outer membrane lipoprotein [Neolewinella xylanilytica]PPK87758.1 SusD-like starch-binding protein associating with outer membrane [Neolewinella xylanilytica]
MKYLIMDLRYMLFGALLACSFSCTEDDLADAYAEPSRIAETTVDKQFTGVLVAGQDYIVPNYTNYFVVLRGTLNPWTQSIGVSNSPNQYVPGSSGVESFWNNYYEVLAQYREMQRIYNNLDPAAQEDRAIFRLAAATYMHYETQRAVDLFGFLPYFDAGMLSTNAGNYSESYASFDSGSDIYTFMLDDLQAIADELASVELSPGVAASFTSQDIINGGDVMLWRRFTNSLRMRMLMRVVEAPEFSSRATAELSEIIGNSERFPTVETGEQNIMIDVFDPTSTINSRGFRDGINSAGWDGDDASQALIDLLLESNDPRLELLFEPGTESPDGAYLGIDPLLDGSEQQQLVNDGLIAFYNRRTFSENEYFPGLLFSAAETSFLLAEYYARTGDGEAAVTAYETGIRQSIDFYLYVNSVSSASTGVVVEEVSDADYQALIESEPVQMTPGQSTEDKIQLIARQKWLHFNIVQPYENWAEVRRLDYPTLGFWTDNSSTQPLPPSRWTIPGREITYNANYSEVSGEDKLTNTLFWDVD